MSVPYKQRRTIMWIFVLATLAVISCSKDTPQQPAGGMSSPSTTVSPYVCAVDPGVGTETADVPLAPAHRPQHTTVKMFTHRLVDGNGDWTPEEIENTVAIIEADLAAGGVHVLRVGEGTHGESPAPGGGYDVQYLMNEYGSDQSIDVFFGSKVGEHPNGWANAIGESPFACAVWGPAVETRVPTHEVGHVLGLPHTHGGKDTGNCPTAVVDADFPPVSDTPPDPGLGHGSRVAEGCVYAPDLVECPFLANYNPDTRNIMSYTRLECLEHFTPSQYSQMKVAYVFGPSIVVNAEVTTNVPVTGGLSTCPQGDGDALEITVDFNLESVASTLGELSSDRITVLPPAPGTGIVFFGAGPFEAAGPANQANGYTTTITVDMIGGCGTAEMEIQLDGHYIATTTVTVNSFDYTASGSVDLGDVGPLSVTNGKCAGDAGYNDCFDFVENNCVDGVDVSAFIGHLGHFYGAQGSPSSPAALRREADRVLSTIGTTR